MRDEGHRQWGVRMPDGNIVSFYEDELTMSWPPRDLDLRVETSTLTTLPEGVERQAPSAQVQGARSTREGGFRPGVKHRPQYDISCKACDHADQHQWFGLSDASHCPRRKADGDFCHATFSGNAQHCAQCHLTFGSEAAFNRHKSGSRCLDPATVRNGKRELQFGEPRLNAHGTMVWRLTARKDSPWTK